MRASSRRSVGTSAFAVVALALSMTGCDFVQGMSTNRGSGSLTEGTTVENAFIVPVFLPDRCAIQLNAGAKMLFTVTNASSTETERLVGVNTNVAASADIDTSIEVPPQSTVGFGEPTAPSVGKRVPPVQLGELDPNLKAGMTANVTFQFDRAGDIVMPVPVEACPRQDEEPFG